jgi:hypothetical protein
MSTLRKLAFLFEINKCTKDSIIIREGDASNKVFIIQEGEFIVSKKIFSKNVETEDVDKIKKNPDKAKQYQTMQNRKGV